MKFIVINMYTDATKPTEWDSFDDAETAAAEANANHDDGSCPWIAVAAEEYAV